MSLCEAITTTAGPTRSARGTGSCHSTRPASFGSARLALTSTTVSPASAWANGITISPDSDVTAATSTEPAGPTSSTLQAGSMAMVMLLTGAPRAATRNRACRATRPLPTS